jgi:sulfur relay (sulfurtransferase) complex TusBCD TusD component (DsrE family)
VKFVIGVFGVSSQKDTSTAFQFAKALFLKNHEISQIFFYCEGVLYAQNKTLFQQLNIPLRVCNTAITQRSVTITKGFEISTLTQFFNALTKADRYVIFNS